MSSDLDAEYAQKIERLKAGLLAQDFEVQSSFEEQLYLLAGSCKTLREASQIVDIMSEFGGRALCGKEGRSAEESLSCFASEVRDYVISGPENDESDLGLLVQAYLTSFSRD